MKGYFIMRQDLWLANSSLLLLFALTLGAYELLQQEPPPWKAPRLPPPLEIEKKKETESTIPPIPKEVLEKILQDDIFGTYIPKDVKSAKATLVTPIPEPKPSIPLPIPDVKKPEFIPPLNITIRGIIASGDDQRNVAIIADETNKEGMYHLGEKIKDAQIIKIAHNRVILLRANGQQETFYLRKDEVDDPTLGPERWKYTVRKINDQTFDVDPTSFTKEVETLGNLIERAAIIGTAYASGKPIGIRIGKTDPNDVATALGLMENDIITTVNDIDIADSKNRISAYQKVIEQTVGSSIKLGLKRANKDVLFSYNLVKIDRPRKTIFPGVKVVESQPQQQPSAEGQQLPMSRLQQHEQMMRDFSRRHVDQQRHEQVNMEIRRRILEGIQQRLALSRNQ